MQEQKATTKPSITLSTDFWDDPRVLLLTDEEKLLYIGVLIMNRRGFANRLAVCYDQETAMSEFLRSRQDYVQELKGKLFELGLIDENWKPLEEI